MIAVGKKAAGVADIIEVDLTEVLSDETIQELFDAMDADEWATVDSIIDGITPETYDAAEAALIVDGGVDIKAGGADQNRGGAEKLRHYWTRGPGGAKIGWGTSGDWTRCVSQLSKHLGPRAKGYCSLRHKEMNGYYPGDKRNKSAASPFDDSLESKDYPGRSETQTSTDGVPMLEHKTVGVTGLKVLNPDEGTIECFISVTGIVDEVKDRIKPGSYAKTLANRKPKGVWSHDWDTPVSRTEDVKELLPGDPDLPDKMPNGNPWPREAGALRVKTRFNLETQRGREAYSDVVFFGDEQEWSIGYNVPVGGARIDSKSGVREIEALELYEYSPVLFGAMPLARTTSVKEAQMAFKALQEFMGHKDALPDETPDDAPAEDASTDTSPVDDGDAQGVDEPVDVVDDEDDPDYDADDDDDDVENKSVLSADNMDLVEKAIDVLKALLHAATGEDEDREPVDDESQETKAVATDEDTDEGYDTLMEAVESLELDDDIRDELANLASDVDDAYDDGDPDALESASTAYLDFIEKSLGESTDDAAKVALKDAADLVVQMMDTSEMPDEGDAGDEENTAEDTTEGGVEEPGETTDAPTTESATGEKVLDIDLDELAALRSVLD